jgi:hypothetical protein
MRRGGRHARPREAPRARRTGGDRPRRRRLGEDAGVEDRVREAAWFDEPHRQPRRARVPAQRRQDAEDERVLGRGGRRPGRTDVAHEQGPVPAGPRWRGRRRHVEQLEPVPRVDAPLEPLPPPDGVDGVGRGQQGGEHGVVGQFAAQRVDPAPDLEQRHEPRPLGDRREERALGCERHRRLAQRAAERVGRAPGTGRRARRARRGAAARDRVDQPAPRELLPRQAHEQGAGDVACSGVHVGGKLQRAPARRG